MFYRQRYDRVSCSCQTPSRVHFWSRSAVRYPDTVCQILFHFFWCVMICPSIWCISPRKPVVSVRCKLVARWTFLWGKWDCHSMELPDSSWAKTRENGWNITPRSASMPGISIAKNKYQMNVDSRFRSWRSLFPYCNSLLSVSERQCTPNGCLVAFDCSSTVSSFVFPPLLKRLGFWHRCIRKFGFPEAMFQLSGNPELPGSPLFGRHQLNNCFGMCSAVFSLLQCRSSLPSCAI